MLLYEILAPPRTLTATDRFRTTFNTFKKVYPIIEDSLRAFVAFRLSHRPDEPFASKDSSFLHKELRGYRHYHMVHGKAILIYQVTATELRLCLVTDHSYSSNIGNSRLINALQGNSYEPLQTEPTHTLTSSEIADIQQILYEFAAEDRDGLIHAITENLDELFEFFRLVISQPWSDDQKDRAACAVFGGRDGLIQAARKILQQTATRA